MTLDYTKEEKAAFVAFIHNTFIWPASFEIAPRTHATLYDYNQANRAHATLIGLNLDGTKASAKDRAPTNESICPSYARGTANKAPIIDYMPNDITPVYARNGKQIIWGIGQQYKDRIIAAIENGKTRADHIAHEIDVSQKEIEAALRQLIQADILESKWVYGSQRYSLAR